MQVAALVRQAHRLTSVEPCAAAPRFRSNWERSLLVFGVGLQNVPIIDGDAYRPQQKSLHARAGARLSRAWASAFYCHATFSPSRDYFLA